MEEQLQTVRGVSTEEVYRFETLFKLFDEDGSGCISIQELGDLMPRLGIFLSEDELQMLFSAVDSDGSGDIDFNEFLALMVRQREANQLALLESGGRQSFTALEEGQTVQGKLWPDSVHVVVWEIVLLVAVLYFVAEVLLADVDSAARLAGWWHVGPALVLAGDLVLRGCLIAVVGGANDDCLEISTNGILRTYLRSPFALVDFISALPIDLILLAAGHQEAALLAGHLRLLKLLRVPSLFPVKSRELMTPLYASLHFAVVPLVRMIFWAVVAVHTLSVLWMAASPAETPYVDACYFVLYTLCTVGYGDIPVTTNNQKVFALFLFLCSTLVTGLVVGKLVQWSQQADLNENTYRSMLETLAVLKHLRVPEDFKREILALQYHRLRTSFSLYESTVAGMPQAMRDRMMLYARMTIVRAVPIFSQQPDICLAKLAMALVNVMVPPEEYIIIAGEEGSEMFFLFHGMCDVYLADGQRVALIRRGGIFGEMALLQATRRAASIRSLTYCQLFRLDKEAFDDITLAFSSLRVAIADEMHRRAHATTPVLAATGMSRSRREDGYAASSPSESSSQDAVVEFAQQPDQCPAAAEEPFSGARGGRLARHLVQGAATLNGPHGSPRNRFLDNGSPAQGRQDAVSPTTPGPVPAPPAGVSVAPCFEVRRCSDTAPAAAEPEADSSPGASPSASPTARDPFASFNGNSTRLSIRQSAQCPRVLPAPCKPRSLEARSSAAVNGAGLPPAAHSGRCNSVVSELQAWSKRRDSMSRRRHVSSTGAGGGLDLDALSARIVAEVTRAVAAGQQGLEGRLRLLERNGSTQLGLIRVLKDTVEEIRQDAVQRSQTASPREGAQSPAVSPRHRLSRCGTLPGPPMLASTRVPSAARLGGVKDGTVAASALLVQGRMKRPSQIATGDVPRLATPTLPSTPEPGTETPAPRQTSHALSSPSSPRTPKGRPAQAGRALPGLPEAVPPPPGSVPPAD
eukprot:TRINITY_DN17697_c0_g1_i3.p1 TRINITY_DN17697_c0_g1~~TRINITY_DN17697_c0_g1_i3.p1  ORF type:complete len:974 (+),score=276.55 TRINITY_DN17697_c0_g1_i3:198-3119(+)